IGHQQNLLSIHRRNLAHYIGQQAVLGPVTMPHIAYGITEARANIQRIKGILRAWGEKVADHIDDDPPSTTPPVAVTGTEQAVSTPLVIAGVKPIADVPAASQATAATGRLLQYQEFEMRLSRSRTESDTYQIEVLRSPEGETNAVTGLPIAHSELHAQLDQLRRLLTEKEQLVDMGTALYEFLFGPRRIAHCWAASLGNVQAMGQGLNLRLRIEDEELARLPWELLYDPDRQRFLIPSLQTPLIRYISMPEPVQLLTIEPPLRILLAISSPPDYPPLDVEREKRWLLDALAPLIGRDNAVSVDVLDVTTRQSLQSKLRQNYHVLHYIGHGIVDPATGSGNLVLTDENTGKSSLQDAETLGYLLRSSSIKLVFLNACQTAVTSGTEAFLGVAQSIVRAGMPAVVAMQFDIPETSAALLARAFYASLADGYSVQAAVTEGRKAVLAKTGLNHKDWATPTLFMRSPTGVLFETRTASSAYASAASRTQVEEQPSNMSNTMPNASELRQIIIEQFDLEELRTLCIDLGVDIDDLRGEGRANKARELIGYLQRRGKLQQLVEYIRRERPNLGL
ncbi:MAG: CHAT domain-containing protein, partial [Roseiflexaceae bacterium]